MSIHPSPLSSTSGRAAGQPLELAVIIPTFNESANIQPMIGVLEEALEKIDYELIFVDDDSPDGTSALVRSIAVTHPRVRVLQRIGRRGLASACIEGMLATPARYIAVIDADLQHDERILPQMLAKLKNEGLDLVIGTRNSEGGSMGDFSRPRVLLSGLGARLSRAVCRCTLSDPMSGFFLIDRAFLEEVVHRLSGLGFKILVDLVSAAQRPVRIGEVPYRFRSRQHGESKLDLNVGIEYISLLLDKMVGDYVPVRFVWFSFVGALGLLVHLAVLGTLLFGFQRGFVTAQVSATVVAMTFNFLLNNLITFRDRRLKGWKILPGLLSYYLACSLGALANASFADSLKSAGFSWAVAGITGMLVSSVWNYGVNTILTWRRARVRR